MIKETKEFAITDGELPTYYDIYRLCRRAKEEHFIGTLKYDGGKIFNATGEGDPMTWVNAFRREYGDRMKNGSPDDYK